MYAEDEVDSESFRPSEQPACVVVLVDELLWMDASGRSEHPRTSRSSSRRRLRRSLSRSRRSTSSRSSLSSSSGISESSSSRSIGSQMRRSRRRKGERSSLGSNTSAAGDRLRAGGSSHANSYCYKETGEQRPIHHTSRSLSSRTLKRQRRHSDGDEYTDTTVNTATDATAMGASEEDLTSKASKPQKEIESHDITKMRHSRGAISTSSHSHSTKSIRSYDGSRSSKEILYGTDGDIKKAKTTKIPRATKPGVDRLRHTWHSPSRSSRTTMDLLYGDNRKIDELDHRSSRHSSASEPGMERVLGTLELLYGDDQDDVKCKARVSQSSRSSKPGVEQVGGDDDDGYSYDFPIASVPREVYSNTVTLPATVGDAAGYDEPSAHDSRNDHHSTATADSVTIVVQGNSREKRRTSPLCIILCILFVLLILVVAVVAGFVLLQDRSDNSNENTQAILGGATNITDAPTPSVTLLPTGVLNSSAPTMIPSTRSPSGAPPT